MTQPVPEERNEAADLEPGDVPPGEHDDELSGGGDGGGAASEQQEENAESSLDQPSS